MTPDEVRLLDNSKCILFIRGERPVIDLKYNLLKHPNIRYTEDGGAAPYDYASADNARDDLPCAPENYELLDMDDFLPAEAVRRGATNWNLYTFLQIHHPMQFSMPVSYTHLDVYKRQVHG